ncbi:hypothetical protein AS850_02755 [Frondihabitans sp. 762G35]|uniref:hypothetical protein n=1 Tax=Frondihabitans sp. 762G35 TaxID=1446794 RepID=UPI000D2131D4|nr:hypothetical protein [Frondihabitans sp. 762G35]ARC55993.1 hypothetical protein AS850_02755 [Frondihabitans sp. 762G35]
MSSNQIPTPGRIVLYTLSDDDAKNVNRRRDDYTSAVHNPAKETPANDGRQNHVGNKAEAGQVVPMIIVRAWGSTPSSSVNGQALLDGNDTLWVTSVSEGEGPRHFQWPSRA